MKYLRSIIFITNALSLFFIILAFSVFFPTFNKAFYSKEYDKYSIAQSINVSKGDLMTVTEKLINYMRGKEDNLNIIVRIGSEEREFFNSKEKAHMEDVKALILGGISIFKISVVIFFLSLLFIIKTKKFLSYVKTVLTVFSVLLVFIISLTAFIALNFESAFTRFHHIFFTNDLWLLNPETDLLINIVPLNFFIDISGLIISIFIGFSAVVMLACGILTRTKKIGG